MNKRSQSVSLALIGSAVFLAGCSGRRVEEQVAAESDWGGTSGSFGNEEDQATAGNGTGARHHGGGFIPLILPLGGRSRGVVAPPPIGGGNRPGAVPVSPGVTSRGGFGSTGRFSAGS